MAAKQGVSRIREKGSRRRGGEEKLRKKPQLFALQQSRVDSARVCANIAKRFIAPRRPEAVRYIINVYVGGTAGARGV